MATEERKHELPEDDRDALSLQIPVKPFEHASPRSGLCRPVDQDLAVVPNAGIDERDGDRSRLAANHPRPLPMVHQTPRPRPRNRDLWLRRRLPLFSLVTRATIQSFGLRWAFIINAFVSLAVLVPSVLLMKSRTATHGAVVQLRDLHWFAHKGYSWILLWIFTILLGSTIAIVTVPTCATARLGLTQSEGASLQAIMAASQIVGRPLTGFFMDYVGRVNGTAIITLIGGLSCLVIWMFARSLGVLVFFCVVQGMTDGIFWAACGPVCAEVVGMGDMASARASLWLVVVIPCLFSEAIGIALVDYSETVLRPDRGRRVPHLYRVLRGCVRGGCDTTIRRKAASAGQLADMGEGVIV